MKLNAQKLTTIILIMCAPVFGLAQHNHGGQSHESNLHSHDHATAPPHGGDMQDAGKYHIEMVVDMLLKENQVLFYLLKGGTKPVSIEGITGTVTFQYADETKVTEILRPFGDDGLVAQLNKKQPFYAVVKFLINGKTISAMFNYKRELAGGHKH